MTRTRRILLGALLLCVGVYAVVVAVLTAIQGSLFFHPNATRADLIAARLDGFSAQTLVTADGEHIIGWWSPPKPGAGVVLYLHGNADNLSALAPRLRDVASTGAGVLAIDYRGYGGSSGSPSERGLYEDARAAWRFVATEAPQRPVVIWGESLGAALAIQLATEKDEVGVVLDSPFSSMVSMAHSRTPWFPSSLVLQRFDSARKIARIGSPLIVAHCEEDRTVPIGEGWRLFTAAREPKRFIALPGCGHVRTWREPAKSAVLAFIRRQLGPAATQPKRAA